MVADPLPYADGLLVGDANGGIRRWGPDGWTVEGCSLPGRRLDALAAAGDGGGLFFAAKGTFGSFSLTPEARRPTTSGGGAGALSVRGPLGKIRKRRLRPDLPTTSPTTQRCAGVSGCPRLCADPGRSRPAPARSCGQDASS